ncbi:hypothetical protein V5O48_003115 [Marasmius crinis-equi]|uniref:Glutathione S-transferase n=1 Tax=Marasmius crinis-equi TaxID=585013 RepID=A0ABR3FTR6_9AGAR
MITVFDLGPSNHSVANVSGVSPYVRTVVFILRYKKIDYELKPVSPFDIARVAQEHGAAPTVTGDLGGHPQIHYPVHRRLEHGQDTPAVVPAGSRVLHKVLQSNLVNIATPMNRRSIQPYIINTILAKEIRDRINFPNATPEQVSEAYKQVREAFETFNENLDRGESFRSFVMGGDKPTFGDFSLVAIVYPVRFIYGEESEQWEDVKSWAKGWLGWEIAQVLKLVAA